MSKRILESSATVSIANPQTLVVTIMENRGLKLNEEGLGTLEDSSRLTNRLAEVLQKRSSERTVFIKAPRSMKYGDVAIVIDGVKGAGARPLGLQLDDLQ
jgi:biopolymer transport protein ExbD